MNMVSLSNRADFTGVQDVWPHLHLRDTTLRPYGPGAPLPAPQRLPSYRAAPFNRNVADRCQLSLTRRGLIVTWHHPTGHGRAS